MAQDSPLEDHLPYLLALSDEVLVMIFSFLNTEDKFSLSKVCRRFDGVLLDRRLCKDIVISPKSEASCLDHIGFYFRKRRQLIQSLNINSCNWIPMAKVTLITKSLPNLVCLNVMNTTLSVLNLSKILKESSQLRELSWSWQDDGKSRSISWSEVPSDERMALSRLEQLHVCLLDPWCLGARELYGFCHSLTHLTVEVDPSFQQLTVPKTNIGENLAGSNKLKSLIAWQNSYAQNIEVNCYIEDSIGLLLKHFWANCGGFNRAWECLWTNAYNQIPWRCDMSQPHFSTLSTNLKSVVIDSVDFANILNELPVSHLVINIPFGEEGGNFPPLIAVAPKLQKFAVIANVFSMDLNSWINGAVGSSECLIEINLFGVHYCGDYSFERLWLALRTLKRLKKLAVAPCVLPKIEKGKGVTSHSETTDVDKKQSELPSLDSLEEFEVGNPSNISVHPSSKDALCHVGTWVPNVVAISIWPKLTCLTIDSITSLRSLQQFKLVALGCRNLASLCFRNLGTKGYCGYVKDISVSLSCFHALKHFRLDQPYIFDQLKDLLVSLSHCINLESIVITNYNVICNSYLKKRENFKPILIQLANSCPHLSLMLITLPDVTLPICNKIKNEILNRISHPKKSSLVLEFCSYPKVSRTNADTYHQFLKFPYNSCHHDELHMFSKVAVSPPLKHVT